MLGSSGRRSYISHRIISSAATVASHKHLSHITDTTIASKNNTNIISPFSSSLACPHSPSLVFIPSQTQLRSYTTSCPDDKQEPPPECTPKEENVGIFQRFKNAYKEYGKVLVGVHVATSTVWFGAFYYAAVRYVNFRFYY